jgi:DHA2 family multidrug resistance protein
LTDPHPIVDLHFFQRRNFRVGAISLAFAYFAFMGSTIIFPLWLQTTLGYTATMAGYAVAPVGILALIISPIFGRNIHRANLRVTASFAFAVFAATSFWMAHMNQTATLFQLAMPRFWQGIGVSFFFLSLNQITLSSVRSDQIAAATGLSNFMRTMAGSIATAVSIWLWNRRTDFHHAVLTEHIRASAYGWTKYQAALQPLGISGARSLQYTNQVLTQQATTLATNDVFYLFSIIFLCIIPFVWMAKPPFGARSAEGAH